MAARAAVRRAIEMLEIQQPEQLDNLDKHCRSILKYSHPDKVEEAKRMEHTERTQLILAARALVRENLRLATEILQSEEAQASTAKARTPLVRRNPPFYTAPKSCSRKLSNLAHWVGIMARRGYATHILLESWNQTDAVELASQQDDRLPGNRCKL